jgi:hypothetical protein
MAGQGGVPTVGTILLALLLCGLLGVLGQGVRAIVGRKNAGPLNSTTPTEQAEFSLAYFVLSLMIGFLAGVIAGIALNLEKDHHSRSEQLEAAARNRRIRLYRRGLHRKYDVGRHSRDEDRLDKDPTAPRCRPAS